MTLKPYLWLSATLILALLVLANFAKAADLPDPVKTPGALDPSVIDQTLTLDELCNTSTKDRRHVTQADKDATFATYGLKQEHRPDCTGPGNACYEIDHDCSLELGCNNVAKNRWPQLFDGPHGAHVKDKLENVLHRLVCAGKVPLHQAQIDISNDWIAAYRKYVGPLQ